MSINTIIIMALVIMAIAGTAVCIFSYLRNRTLEDIRADVYQLFLKAEHKYLQTGAGQQKMKWVIQQARGLLPIWARRFITDVLLERIIEEWFQAVKDLLDDGKINKSNSEEKNHGEKQN